MTLGMLPSEERQPSNESESPMPNMPKMSEIVSALGSIVSDLRSTTRELSH